MFKAMMGKPENDFLKRFNYKDPNKKFFYITACASIPDWLLTKLDDSQLVFFDGTLWLGE